MPSKSAMNKETSAKESARKVTPRVSTARHRTKKSPEVPANIDVTGESMSVNPGGTSEDSRGTIASIAYGYWESRGYQGGDPVADWIRAEQEYNSRRPMAASAAA